jgi:hypothetical protein
LANESIAVIDELLEKTRIDQDAVYLFVRTINRNIDTVTEDSDFVANVRTLTSKLRTASYNDWVFQNANLSKQIQTRIPLLIEDSLKLSENGAVYLRQDFLDELTIFTQRYMSANRFRAGFGISYSYIPTLSYSAISRVDLSPFQTNISGGSDRLFFNNEFSNSSYPSFALNARIPYFTVEAIFPTYDEERSSTTGVVFRDIDNSSRDIKYQSKISSKLELEYDISVRLSVYDLIMKLTKQPATGQIDFGAGAGFVGFEVTDRISTDIRFTQDPNISFDQLTTSETLEFEDSRSFNSRYYVLYATFELTDEFFVGTNIKYHRDSSNNNGEIEVDGYSVGLTGIWYPTLSFLGGK